MRYASVCVLIAACTPTSGDYPITPGGGLATTTGAPGSGSTTTVSGRVCVIADPRVLGGCAAAGAGGLVVAVGAATTRTMPSGAFQLVVPAPVGPQAMLTVSSPSIVTSAQPLSPSTTAVTVPAIPADLFEQTLAANGITLTAGAGSIFASVLTRGGTPVAGVTAASTPSPAFGPFFDGTTPTAWQLNATGARGVVMFPGVTIGPANLTFTDRASAGETTVDGVQVIDGGVTFVDAVLP